MVARISITLSVATNGTLTLGGSPDVLNTVAVTTVDTDIATLVADGASPTQAHVTALNTAWTALKAGTGPIPAKKDLVLSFDTTKWTRSTIRAALQQMIFAIDGGQGGLGA